MIGVKSKSFIWFWVSGKSSIENHFEKDFHVLPSLSCTFQGMPGMSFPFCFHLVVRSEIFIWAYGNSLVAYHWRWSPIVSPISAEERISWRSQVFSPMARVIVYRTAKRGEIPCYRNGSILMFYKDEILTWVDSTRENK